MYVDSLPPCIALGLKVGGPLKSPESIQITPIDLQPTCFLPKAEQERKKIIYLT